MLTLACTQSASLTHSLTHSLGGTLVTAPCSHVGHIFRDTHPYTLPGRGMVTIAHIPPNACQPAAGGKSIGDTFMRNTVRLAEVWLDEYKQYFYQMRPEGCCIVLIATHQM